MPTPENIVHAMSRRSRKKLLLAATLSGGVYTYLAAAGRIKMEDGGPEIENPLITGSNPNITDATYYDTVPVDQSDELDTVLYSMARLVGTLIISDQELDENKGDAKIVSIMEAKLKALEHGIKQKQRQDAATLGSGGAANGLPNLMPHDPTTGTVGGIDLSTEVLFRPSAYHFDGGLDQNNIEQALDDMLMDLTTDGESPTAIFMGRNLYRLHTSAAREKSQISLSSTGFGAKLINLGIKGTTHQTLPVIYDEVLDPDQGFIINENHMNLHILKGANMKLKKLTAPWDMDAVGRRYVYESQICSWKNYRTHANFSNKAP